MNQDDRLDAFIRRFDPAPISYERLDRLEELILKAALATPQRNPMLDMFFPETRKELFRLSGMACMMLFLGMLAGQTLPSTTKTAQHDLATIAWSMPWQELAQNDIVD